MRTQGMDGLDGVTGVGLLMEQVAQAVRLLVDDLLGRIASGMPTEQARQWAGSEAARRVGQACWRWLGNVHEEAQEDARGSATEGEDDAEAL